VLVQITGMPLAIASVAVRPQLSYWDGIMRIRVFSYTFLMSCCFSHTSTFDGCAVCCPILAGSEYDPFTPMNFLSGIACAMALRIWPPLLWSRLTSVM
jgi:hypothetical protein